MMVEALSEDARTILAFIKDHPGVQPKHVGAEIRIDGRRLYEVIKELQDRGLIEGKIASEEKYFALRLFLKI